MLKKISFVLVSLLVSIGPVSWGQLVNRDVAPDNYDFGSLDPVVNQIFSRCQLRFRVRNELEEFRFSDYEPNQIWIGGSRHGGTTSAEFPRRPQYLYRGITIPTDGRPAQFTLNTIVRGILGDESQNVGGWGYSSLDLIFRNPAGRSTGSAEKCVSVDTNRVSTDLRPFAQNVCFLKPEVRVELTRAVNNDPEFSSPADRTSLDTLVNCVVPMVNQLTNRRGLNPDQSAELAQVFLNRSLMNLRRTSREATNWPVSPNNMLANSFFRYLGAVDRGANINARNRSYREWSTLAFFAALQPEITTFYGDVTFVFSDPGHRALDLNAFNHAYYLNSGMTLTRNNGRTSSASNFYSCSPVDNSEFIVPGYVRAREFEGIDVHPAHPTGNEIPNREGRSIQVAYRRIPVVNPSTDVTYNHVVPYTPVLVIDARDASCVTLDAQSRPVKCQTQSADGTLSSRNADDPFENETMGAPVPSANPADRLPVIGIIGLCQNPEASTCVIPPSLVEKYGYERALGASPRSVDRNNQFMNSPATGVHWDQDVTVPVINRRGRHAQINLTMRAKFLAFPPVTAGHSGTFSQNSGSGSGSTGSGSETESQ